MTFRRALIASLLIFSTMGLSIFFSQSRDMQLKKPFSDFPKAIGPWSGQERRFDQQIYDILGVEDSFLGDYSTAEGDNVNLYIGFYESQRKGDIIHSPRNCMPGGGWNITKSTVEELEVPNHNPVKIAVNRLIIENAGEKQVVLYWFQSRGRFITSEYNQKIYLVIDSITKRRTDGSFVRLLSSVGENGEHQTTEAMKDFVRLLLPILDDYLPA